MQNIGRNPLPGAALRTALLLVTWIGLGGLVATGACLLAGCQAAPPDQVSAPAVASELTVAPADLDRLGLKSFWADQLQMRHGDRIQRVALLSSPDRTGPDTLVALTRRNFCYIIKAQAGQIVHIVQIAEENTGAFQTPSFDGVHYFFAGTDMLVGVNAASGVCDIQMKLEMPSRIRPISDREFVYTGGLDGKIFAYAIDSQVKHWESKVGPAVVSLDFCKGNLVAARSDVRPGGQGEVLMFRPTFWTELWSQFTDGQIRAPVVCGGPPVEPPAVKGEPPPDYAIFVASADGSLYRFNPQHGWSEWRVRTPAPLVDSPVMLKNYILQLVPGSGTWAVNRLDGAVAWKDARMLKYLGQSKDAKRMYFLDGATLVAKDPKTGKTLGEAPITGGDLIPVADPDGTLLYLFDAAGHMLCLNDQALPYIRVSPK